MGKVHNEGGQEGHNSPGTKSPWARCVGRRKGPTMSQVLSSTVHLLHYICFGKTSGSHMGAPNLLIVLGAIQPFYVPGMGRKIEVQETVHKDFKFCQAIFAPPSKWRPWHVPCLPYPRCATGVDHEVSQVLLELQPLRTYREEKRAWKWMKKWISEAQYMIMHWSSRRRAYD